MEGLDHLDKCADDAQTGEPQVLEGSSLACGIEEWVEEEGDMSWT